MARHRVPRPMSDALLERVAEQFRALGEPSRLKLMSALFDGELAVGGLAERSGLSLANVSKHLGVLFQAGWVTRRKAGLTVVYALADDRAEHLCELMCDRVRQRAASEASIAGNALPQSRLAARTRPR